MTHHPETLVANARRDHSPWAVEAHVAQTDQLGAESGAFVDELAAALEEIDAAARSIGCW